MEDAMTDRPRRPRASAHRLAVAETSAPEPLPVPLPDRLPPAATVGISPKATWTTAAAGVLGLTLAALNGLQQQPALIAFLPPWAQWGLLTLAPMLLVALAGYWAPAGDIYVPGDPGPIASVRTPEERPAVPSPAAEDTMAAWLARSEPVPQPPLADEPGPLPDDDLDDDDPYWDRPDTSADEPAEHESVDSATEPRGVRSSGWPYEGGSHETGYPRIP